MSSSPTRINTATTGPSFFPGDVNCSGTTDAFDSLQILSFAAGLTTTASDCLQQHGNVNCDASIDVADAVLDLHYAAGLPIDLTQGCPAIGGPATPEALTRALNKATTAGDADWVLKLIYQQLGMTVITKDGQLIQGDPQALTDGAFYLYDFESSLMASDLAARELSDLDSVVIFLNESDVHNGTGGQPWTEADLLSFLAVKATAARADETQFAWRLIDKLGLLRPQSLDLTAPGLDPTKIYLDPAQAFLIMYEMALEATAGTSASAEDVSAQVNPPPPPPPPLSEVDSKAMQDSMLFTDSFHVNIDDVQDTRWRQPTDSDVVNRTMTLHLTFDPESGLAHAITSGILANVAIPDVGGVSGGAVNWLPSPGLVPQNGKMQNGAASHITDADGASSNVFMPKRVCPAGTGSDTIVHELGHMEAVVRIEVHSLFGEHTSLGVFGKRSEGPGTLIDVSHHDGAVPLSLGSAQPLEAAADVPPCAYEGTGNSVHHDKGVGITTKDVVYTVTGIGLRFEMTSIENGRYIYTLTAGTVNVVVTGSDTDPALLCTWSGGSHHDVEEPNTASHAIFGSMQIVPGSGYSIVAGAADLSNPVQVVCKPSSGQGGSTFYSIPSFMLVPHYVGPNDLEPTSDLQTLSGGRDGRDDPDGIFGPGSPSHYEWNLHAASCTGSPQPICQ